MCNIRKPITVKINRTFFRLLHEIFFKFFTPLNHAGENKKVNQRPDNT